MSIKELVNSKPEIILQTANLQDVAKVTSQNSLQLLPHSCMKFTEEPSKLRHHQ